MSDEEPFYRDPCLDAPEHVEQVLRPESGAHRFFRLSGPRMQARFTDVADLAHMPRILIHGNPHIANYCKTRMGTAMADFDRSRIGPYAYDIVRFLVSVSLCRAQPDEALLHPIISDHFRRGYLYGMIQTQPGYEEMHDLRTQAPKKWQRSTRNYLDSGRKWAKRLAQSRVKTSKRHIAMLKDYLNNRDELHILERYRLVDLAESKGSMGKMHHLYLLQDRKDKRDSILFDIKEVYDEPDTKWFENPFEHNGIRMNKAGEIYAPGWEQRPGHASHKGEEYWVRQIPTQQVKLNTPLSDLEQCDLCFAVGSQLGSGHARAAKKKQAQAIRDDFEANFDLYLGIAGQLRKELLHAFENYCKRAQKKKRLAKAH